MPHVESPSASSRPDKRVRKLVLCFDGTGNEFQGNTSDTNIVKIYDKLDRDNDAQYHYYQPGIGTYDISGGSLNKGTIGNFTSKISRAIDSGIATSFDVHVMAGYRFLMNHYKPGAKIYMFGFSRGAFTARFLARMINRVGLLSKGNDEMIPFAYSLYQSWEQAKDEKEIDVQHKKNLLNNFTSTFCRRDKSYHKEEGKVCYTPVKIYFLGIFDCVSSVAVLETPFGRTPKPVSVVGTAEHVRHAVAVDEFRVKFKAALLNQDLYYEKYEHDEDVKEVWFPGNHGDVGGGWPAHSPEEQEAKPIWWHKILRVFFKDPSGRATKDRSDDAYQMSDIPLSWMIREIELIGAKEESYALKWSPQLEEFKKNLIKKKEQAYKASRHNTMSFGRGSSWLKVLMWKFMDYVPLFPRYELQEGGKWIMQTWPPNMASARDIPNSALLHASVYKRITDQTRERRYKPRNNHGSGDPCLQEGRFIKVEAAHDDTQDVDHTLYALEPMTVEDLNSSATKIVTPKANARKAHIHTGSAARSSAVNGINGLKSRQFVVSAQEVSN
ncbi:hypothetical protein K504DRAFT_389108 [Pleomassaria siparia CBS 279.74]|uniref:T6SS Phospholipase effector Tle1-like catalytic domain-containing protein n=1 Tax=Pleomassaria siparia CBS 279.74 TaxID=1314801 RepID=A0A6G1JXJ9_9PLEO|nr:hypothetical protein K504DRAFT_389108 [Pleomassaria siparia CBS 279.74]